MSPAISSLNREYPSERSIKSKRSIIAAKSIHSFRLTLTSLMLYEQHRGGLKSFVSSNGGGTEGSIARRNRRKDISKEEKRRDPHR